MGQIGVRPSVHRPLSVWWSHFKNRVRISLSPSGGVLGFSIQETHGRKKMRIMINGHRAK